MRVAQVRLVFGFTNTARTKLFGSLRPDLPARFAYVEWFSRIPDQSNRWHGLKTVERTIRDDERLVSIIPIKHIKRSVSLIPAFGPHLNPSWTSDNVLEFCKKFYLNSYSDKHAYVKFR